MSKDQNLADALDNIDAAKRSTLTRLITGTAFVTPVIASYALDALSISKAQAGAPNGSGKPAPSDRRFKNDIRRVATLPSGLGLYRFKYLWSDIAYVGVMAQEVREVMPDAVIEGSDGFLRVDYAVLGLEMVTYAAWCERNGTFSDAMAA
jgi:hypothetical protein